jgi:uncharacterized protein YkwD
MRPVYLSAFLISCALSGAPAVLSAQSTIDTPVPTWVVPLEQSGPNSSSGENWLGMLNKYRGIAKLPAAVEDSSLNDGCRKHALYIVKTNRLEHQEDAASPWFTPVGDSTAKASVLTAGTNVDSRDESSVENWISTPFHALPLLDPALERTGFGSYRESDGGWQWAAVLRYMNGTMPSTVTFPVAFPAEGSVMPLTEFRCCEAPDPLAHCGYGQTAGAPIILQLGPNAAPPQIGEHSLMLGNSVVEHCIFDETTFTSPNESYQTIGRLLLNIRNHAIVIMPRAALVPGGHYTVSIANGSTTHTWSFDVAGGSSSVRPAAMEMPPAAVMPNPVTDRTMIGFTLESRADVSVEIFDMLGRSVASLQAGSMESGSHMVEWDATGATPGEYYYRLRAGERSASGVILKK